MSINHFSYNLWILYLILAKTNFFISIFNYNAFYLRFFWHVNIKR